jgi:SAM-dependent methyltransferase
MKRDFWNDRYSSTDLVWSAEPNRFLVEQLEGLAPGRALELACGEGRNALWLAKQGWTVTASDFASVAIDKAKARAQQLGLEVDFQVADATNAVDGAFDLVIIFYLQIPREEFVTALGVAAAALAPGGTLLVVGHDTRNLTEGYGGPKSASVLYTPADITAALPDLQVVRAETVDRPVDTDDGQRVALDALARLVRPS